MSSVSQPLAAPGLERLHRSAVEEPRAVRALLERLHRAGVRLRNGMDHRNRRREARIEGVGRDRLRLQGTHIDPERQDAIHFSFELDGSAWFFSTRP